MHNLVIPIEQRSSANFWEGREGHTVKAIVVHKTEGELDGALEWLTSPKSQASVHFMISRSGKIYQLVDTQNSAWHCGVVVTPTWSGMIEGVNPNYYTIGIELVGFAAQATPGEQLAALEILLAFLGNAYSLTLADDTVVFHHEIDGAKLCPGPNVSKPQLITNATLIQRALSADAAGPTL